MKCSDLFVKRLENEGVKYVFGVPGEENADMMMSLEDSPIEFILTRHEQGAAFMAKVWSRLTGTCGVCLGTLGPGAANLVTGVADANMDRAPLVVLTSQADSKRQHKESHQAMNVVDMFRPVTKWAHAILHPDNTPEVIRKAFRLAKTEKPGACHIELAEDIAKLDAGTKPISFERFRRPGPDDKIVDRAWECIKNARRPIILAGNGTIRRRASKQLRRFVEATGIGVISTFMAKGCVDVDSEQCLYTVGLQSKDFPTGGGAAAKESQSANERIQFACIGVDGKGSSDSRRRVRIGETVLPSTLPRSNSARRRRTIRSTSSVDDRGRRRRS